MCQLELSSDKSMWKVMAEQGVVVRDVEARLPHAEGRSAEHQPWAKSVDSRGQPWTNAVTEEPVVYLYMPQENVFFCAGPQVCATMALFHAVRTRATRWGALLAV